MHPDDRPAYERHLVRLSNGESTEDSVRIIGLDGATRWVSFRAWPASADGGIVVHGIAADVTGKMALERVLKATVGAARREAEALEEARREADHLARTDALTGVFNRRHLNEELAASLARAAAGSRPPALLLLDVDHFKRINDSYGHAAGDAVLVAVARRVAGSVRTTDIAARWGGEEFCVLLEGVDNDDALREVAEGVRLRIEAAPIEVEGVEIAVTVSVGAARATAGPGRAPTTWSTPPTGRSTPPSGGGATRRASTPSGCSRTSWRRIPRRSASPRRSRSPRACARARRASTRCRSPTCRCGRPSCSARPPPSCCAAASAAGCTTSARSRSPTASSRSPARSTTSSAR